jgi:hypothetical protein
MASPSTELHLNNPGNTTGLGMASPSTELHWNTPGNTTGLGMASPSIGTPLELHWNNPGNTTGLGIASPSKHANTSYRGKLLLLMSNSNENKDILCLP